MPAPRSSTWEVVPLLALTVFSTGLALVGIGVSVDGLLSTSLIVLGLAVCLGSALLWIFRRGHGSSGGLTVTAGRDANVAGRDQYIAGRDMHVGPQPDPKETDEREIIDVPPERIVAPYATHTQIQAEKLTEVYIGKWITVSGAVTNVEGRPDEIWVSIRAGQRPADAPEEAARLQILLVFDEVLRDRLSMLQHGDELTATGRIDAATGGFIALKDCELQP